LQNEMTGAKSLVQLFADVRKACVEVAISDRALTDAEIRGLEDAAGDLIFRSGFEY